MNLAVPEIPLGAAVKMFLHSRSCLECRVRLWAVLAMEYSGKAVIFATHGHRQKAWLNLQVAKFFTRRRVIAMRALGLRPFEDMSPEEQKAAIAAMSKAGVQLPSLGERPRLH